MSKPHPAGPSHPEGEPVRRVLAVIPARGGSKGVPAKNLAPVGGVPLVARAIRACVASPLVTDVVVSTDDTVIAETARAAGAEVVLRPAAIAGDTATSEAAVLHAMDGYEQRHGVTVDVVLLVQCTSPFIVREDVDGVVGAITRGGADTAHTVAPFHGFVWRDASDEPPAIEGERTAAEGGTTTVVTDTTTSGGYGVNHDKSFRPRRQDRPQDHQKVASQVDQGLPHQEPDPAHNPSPLEDTGSGLVVHGMLMNNTPPGFSMRNQVLIAPTGSSRCSSM